METTQDGMMSLLGPGQLNDLLLGYYQDNGASSSNITDAEYEFLLSRGALAENVQDMWDWYLRDLGYSGSLSDMLLDFWSISREGLTLYTRPLVDDVGKSSRTVFKPQSGLFAVGDYLTGDIASGTTVVSEEGTGAISLSEDRLDYTDTEFLWSFALSNGSIYEHPTIVGTDAIWFDTSGNGRHLTGSVADINAHHHVDDTLTFGSDWLNQMGWSDGTGEYSGVSIPSDITGLLDILSNTLTYPGRAKYDIELVNNPTTLLDGIGDFIELDSPIVLSGDFIITGRARFTVDGANRALIGGDSTGEGLLRIFSAGYIQAFVDGISHGFGTISPIDGEIYDWELKRVGTALTATVGDLVETDEVPCSTNDFTIRYIGKYSTYFWQSEIHSVTLNDVHFPLEESEGTTVYGYDSEGATYTGTVTASDIGAFRSGEKAGKNHNYLYGSTEGLPDGVELWENLVPDPSFTESDGVITLTGTTGFVFAGDPAVIGQRHLFEFDYDLPATGAIQAAVGGDTGTAINAPASGSFSEVLTATTTVKPSIYSASATGTIRNISVQHIPAGKIPANPNTGLSVLGQPLTVTPRRLTGQIWQHVECMDIRVVDIDCGGNYFYNSASSYVAFARSLTEWQALDGSDQVFQGPKGETVYTTDQDAAAQVKINKTLGN